MGAPTVRNSLVACVNEREELLYYVTEDDAWDMVKAREATVVSRNGKMRRVLLKPGIRKPMELELRGRGKGTDGTRYITQAESETNPPNVWRFTRLGPIDQIMLMRVVAGCLE